MRVTVERLMIEVLVAGFAIGTTMHALALLNRGWVVILSASIWMNGYWIALTFLDPLAAVLLRPRRSRLTGAPRVVAAFGVVNW